MADMTGQVALVTGGARGIGKAISERLAGRGMQVAVGYSSDKDTADQLAAQYKGMSVHQGNIGERADCERVVSEVYDTHGRIDLLVNNAGITADKMMHKMEVDDWDKVIQVNLSGTFYMSHLVYQHMLERGSGRIVSISSVIGERGNAGQANYAATKSGLFGLTMSLATEAARKGITVTAWPRATSRPTWSRASRRRRSTRSSPGSRCSAWASPTRWPAWSSSSPTPSRPTSAGRSTRSTAGSTCSPSPVRPRAGRRSVRAPA